jgi:hypothetical protein
VAVTPMPRRTALRTVLLVPSGTVSISQFQGRTVDTTLANTSASEPERRSNESDQNRARQTRLRRQRCRLLDKLCSHKNRGGRRCKCKDVVLTGNRLRRLGKSCTRSRDQIISRNVVCAFGIGILAVSAHCLFAIAAVLRSRRSAGDTGPE